MEGRPGKEPESETKACQDDELWVEEVINYKYIQLIDAILMATPRAMLDVVTIKERRCIALRIKDGNQDYSSQMPGANSYKLGVIKNHAYP